MHGQLVSGILNRNKNAFVFVVGWMVPLTPQRYDHIKSLESVCGYLLEKAFLQM